MGDHHSEKQEAQGENNRSLTEASYIRHRMHRKESLATRYRDIVVGSDVGWLFLLRFELTQILLGGIPGRSSSSGNGSRRAVGVGRVMSSMMLAAVRAFPEGCTSAGSPDGCQDGLVGHGGQRRPANELELQWRGTESDLVCSPY
jgi:hypothetical protein